MFCASEMLLCCSTVYKVRGVGLQILNMRSCNSCWYSSWYSVGLLIGSVISSLVGCNEPDWGRGPKGDSRMLEELALYTSTLSFLDLPVSCSAEAPSGHGSRAYPSSLTQAYILSFSEGKKRSHCSLIMPSVAEERIASITGMAQGPLAFQLPLQERGRCSGNLGEIFRTEFSVKILKLPEILYILGEQQRKCLLYENLQFIISAS